MQIIKLINILMTINQIYKNDSYRIQRENNSLAMPYEISFWQKPTYFNDFFFQRDLYFQNQYSNLKFRIGTCAYSSGYRKTKLLCRVQISAEFASAQIHFKKEWMYLFYAPYMG